MGGIDQQRRDSHLSVSQQALGKGEQKRERKSPCGFTRRHKKESRHTQARIYSKRFNEKPPSLHEYYNNQFYFVIIFQDQRDNWTDFRRDVRLRQLQTVRVAAQFS